MATEEHPPAFPVSIWPPTQRTRDAVVRRLVGILTGDGGDTALRKRYGTVPAADAEPAARAIEVEAFDAASSSASGGGASSSSVEDGIEALQLYSREDGIEALQLYSREVSSRLLDFVRSRSAASATLTAAGEVA